MIFKPQLVEQIKQGRKTVTRRLVQAQQPCRYEVGRDYAVQPGRGRAAVLRIVVLDVEQQLLGDLTHDAARAEGFRDRAAFARHWLELHDAKVAAAAVDCTGDDLLATWLYRHGARGVWVITFERQREQEWSVPDRPRYLHRSVVRGVTTDSRMRAIGEPEVIGGPTYFGAASRAQREAKLAHQAIVRRASSVAAHVRSVLTEAELAGVDVADDVAAIERRVHALQRKLSAA